MPLEIVVKGSDKRLLADHAVLVVTLDENGTPIPVGGGGGATETKQDVQIAQADNILGQNGSDFVADTSAHAGSYIGFVVITDAVISSITLTAKSSGAAALAGKTLVAGLQVLVPLESIQLTSGTIQLVK